jgi:hypothetical protein
MEDQAEYRTPNIQKFHTKEEVWLQGAMGVCGIRIDDLNVALIIELYKAVLDKKELLTLDDVIKIKVDNDKRFAELKNKEVLLQING